MEPKIEHISHGPLGSSGLGNSLEFEAHLPLSDRLKVFKKSQFEPDNFVTAKCHAMTEKVNQYDLSFEGKPINFDIIGRDSLLNKLFLL